MIKSLIFDALWFLFEIILKNRIKSMKYQFFRQNTQIKQTI